MIQTLHFPSRATGEWHWLLLHRVVKLVGKFRVDSFEICKLPCNPIFIVQTCVRQPEAVVGLRMVRLDLERLFKSIPGILILVGLVTRVSQSVESLKIVWVKHSCASEGLSGFVELTRAKGRSAKSQISRFII